jgi:hypothetical protein
VVESRFVGRGERVSVLPHAGGVFYLSSGNGHLERVRADRCPRERDERQVASNEPFLDRPELRLVGLDVEVDAFKLADRLAFAVDEILAVPFCDALVRDRCLGLLAARLGRRRGPSRSSQLLLPLLLSRCSSRRCRARQCPFLLHFSGKRFHACPGVSPLGEVRGSRPNLGRRLKAKAHHTYELNNVYSVSRCQHR